MLNIIKIKQQIANNYRTKRQGRPLQYKSVLWTKFPNDIKWKIDVLPEFYGKFSNYLSFFWSFYLCKIKVTLKRLEDLKMRLDLWPVKWSGIFMEMICWVENTVKILSFCRFLIIFRPKILFPSKTTRKLPSQGWVHVD